MSGDASILPDPSAPLVTPDSGTVVAPAAVVEEAGAANPTAATAPTNVTTTTPEPLVAAENAPVDGHVTGRRLRSFGGV